MKAAVITEPYRISVRDVPKPAPGPEEVLVAIRAAGICGSDMHFYDGSSPIVFPQILGHELAGIVEEVGNEVRHLKAGDRVVIEPGVACGRCYPCRIGKYNCCVNIQTIGIERAGGFAEYVAVPEKYAHRMPDGMSFEVGALVEPFTIGAQIVDRAGIRPGHTVTVIGTGPIGLTVIVLLKRLHNVKLFAVDVVPERLDKALRFGADVPINAGERDPIEAIAELTNGEGSNIVIECVGAKRTIEQTVDMVSHGGRIVVAGVTFQDVSFHGRSLTKKEVEIVGSRNSAGKFPSVIDFLNRNRDIADLFITHNMPFQQTSEAFQIAKTKPDEVTKIILGFKEGA